MPTDLDVETQPGLDLEKVARYRHSMRVGWGKGDTNEWPVKLNAAMHLFLREFGEELLDDLAWLEAHGHSLDGLARDFYNPARFFRVIDAVIYGMRRNRYAVPRQREVILKLLAMAKALKHGSEFNEDGRNIVYDEDGARQAWGRLGPRGASLKESQTIHQLCAALWAYTEAICFGAHDLTKEFHGPYAGPAGGGRLLVKEFLNLRPSLLWPDVPLLPFQTVVVYQQYAEAIRLAVDALGHVSHEGGRLVPSLEAWAIEFDGVPQDIAAAAGLIPRIQASVAAIARQMASATWNEKVLKYAEVFWFRKKPLADRRGRDWRVPAHVRETIAAGSENVRWKGRLPDDACERLAMVTI